MKQDVQTRLIRRILAHLDAGTTDTATEVSGTSVMSYTSPERYELEIERIFMSQPHVVCHASQLTNPGDFITRDMARANVLVVNDDGTLRAFLNVCRHRGTRVVDDAAGCRKAFTCPYHGWTYGRDGSLRGLPSHKLFGAIDRADHALVQLPLQVVCGLVFVRPTPGPIADIRNALGPIADDLDSFDFANHFTYGPVCRSRKINWKLAIDLFLETYHIRMAHKDSIYPMFFDNVGIVDSFPPHLRNVFPKRSIQQMRQQPEADWSLRHNGNILYHLFPTTMLLVMPDHAALFTTWPEGIDRSRVEAITLVSEAATTSGSRAYWEANNEILYRALDEDFAMGESIQSGFSSGANQRLTFARFEHALTYFHKEVSAALA